MASTHELDMLYVKNPTPFDKTVKWGGELITLRAGDTQIFQRFIAEHFAKHLTNDILLRMEKKHKDDFLNSGKSEKDYQPVNYLNKKTLRVPTMDSIIIGTYRMYQSQGANPGSIIQQQIDQVNREAKQESFQNAGVSSDPLMGAMEEDDDDTPLPPPPTPNPPLPTPAMTAAPVKPQPSPTPLPNEVPLPPQPVQQQTEQQPVPAETTQQKRARLIKEAGQLGVKSPQNLTVDQLLAEIKQFA
jgi:outer membrane biosynthesis protein TonB